MIPWVVTYQIFSSGSDWLGSKIGFQNEIFKNLLFRNYKVHIYATSSNGSPLFSLVIIMPLGSKDDVVDDDDDDDDADDDDDDDDDYDDDDDDDDDNDDTFTDSRPINTGMLFSTLLRYEFPKTNSNNSLRLLKTS